MKVLRSKLRDDRLHLRLPRELKERLQRYARARHTTVSALIIAHFTKLLSDERGRDEDTEQI
jgi:predicted transcriptional regulator